MKRTRFLLVLDTILFLALIPLLEPRFLGLAIHEWLGLAVLPLIVIHIVCGWRWIVTTLSRLREPGAWRLRVNAVLNTLLFVTFAVTVFAGAMTSFIALPALGIAPGTFEGWRMIHNQWADYVLVLAGLHLAMNWGWIAGAVRRHVLARPTTRGDAALGALAATPEES